MTIIKPDIKTVREMVARGDPLQNVAAYLGLNDEDILAESAPPPNTSNNELSYPKYVVEFRQAVYKALNKISDGKKEVAHALAAMEAAQRHAVVGHNAGHVERLIGLHLVLAKAKIKDIGRLAAFLGEQKSYETGIPEIDNLEAMNRAQLVLSIALTEFQFGEQTDEANELVRTALGAFAQLIIALIELLQQGEEIHKLNNCTAEEIMKLAGIPPVTETS